MTELNLTEQITIQELRNITDRALDSLGLTPHERNIVIEVLMYAELRGKSQGLVKILEKTVVPAIDRTTIDCQQRGPCVAALTANGNIGMVVLQNAADKAIEMCADTGLALATTCGTCTSTGSIGYYAERIAQRGYIGIVLAGSPKVMALHGSRQASMGTNPLAIALPTEDDPLVVDMATSSITVFEMIKLSRQGGQLPPGVAYDSAGQPTLSPAAGLAGVLSTFAGAKGSALALTIECLTGPLTGASMVGDTLDSRGNLVIAIDPEVVLGSAPQSGTFAQRMTQMLQRMRSGDSSIGADQNSAVEGSDDNAPDALRLPGDVSKALAVTAIATGKLEISSSILDGLREM